MQTWRKMLGWAGLTTLVMLGACFDQESTPTEPEFSAAVVGEQLRMQPDGTEQYLVRLVDAVEPMNVRGRRDVLLDSVGGHLKEQFEHVLGGRAFVAWLEPADARALAGNPQVRSVTKDEIIYPPATRAVTSPRRWHLDRIDARSAMDDDYTYYKDGTGVHVYLVDTGIDTTHTDFSGRIGTGRARPWVDSLGYHAGAPYDPASAHGTYSAGVAVGSTYGIATDATIHAVRVAKNLTSTASEVVAGIEWVIDNALSPAVVQVNWNANSNDLKDAIEDVIAEGFLVVLPSGNEGESAGNYASNNAAGALVMGGTDSLDVQWSMANYGSAVDVLAPADAIRTTDLGGGNTNPISGTSFAGPMGAGVAALILEHDNNLTPAELHTIIVESATGGQLSSLNGSPDKLLYSLFLWMDDIDGEDIYEEGNHTFSTVDVMGGSGTYTYKWWYSTTGTGYSSVGTSSSYTRNVSENDSDFYLKAEITSASGTYTTAPLLVKACWNHAGMECEAQ